MKKIINRLYAWSQTPVGDAVILGLVVIGALACSWLISWGLWCAGIWG
ncbi:MAG TPA: hypothetical protein PL124_12990 [Candidatus Cloacimonadota bacterium]|nr:hypothetical protein [Candidatus Cloacimonadota bacterium]